MDHLLLLFAPAPVVHILGDWTCARPCPKGVPPARRSSDLVVRAPPALWLPPAVWLSSLLSVLRWVPLSPRNGRKVWRKSPDAEASRSAYVESAGGCLASEGF